MLSRMTREQRNILVKISNALSAKVEGITSPLPLLCYALDPDILSKEDYEKITDVDLIEFSWYKDKNSSTPEFCLGALLLFIRNFYEKGDGHDIWKSTQGLAQVKVQNGFVECIKKDRICKKWSKSKLFPCTGRECLDWVRSQCWVIRAENGGISSDVLKNNAKLYDSLLCSFDARKPWAGGSQFFDDWKVPDVLSNERYIKWLFENHKWLLIQSLYAIAADGEAPDDLPNWLKPLWGLKRNAIRENLKENRQNAESSTPKKIKASWMMRYRSDDSEVVLKLRDCSSDRSIAQGSLSFSPRRDYVSVYDLIDRGFDMERPLLIKSGESDLEVCSLLKSVDEPGLVFIAPAGKSDKSQYGGILTDCKKWRPRVCMLHLQNKSPELLCGDQECKCIRKNTTYKKDGNPYFYTSLYSLPICDGDTCKISADVGCVQISLENKVGVEVANALPGVSALKDGLNCVVVEGSQKKAEITFSRAQMSYIELDGTTCHDLTGIGCRIVGRDFYTPYELKFKTAGQKLLKQIVLFVPDDFFETSKYLDLSEPRRWRFTEENCLFTGELECAEWGWNGDKQQYCYEGDDDPMLTIYPPYSYLELRVGGEIIKKDSVLCANKKASQLLSLFENLIPESRAELYINNKLAYRGVYRPNGSCIYKSGHEIRFYNKKRLGTVHIKHELYYRYLLDEQERGKYERVFDAERAFRNVGAAMNSVVIDTGCYNFNCPGAIIFEQGCEKDVCFEIPYKGDKKLEERWNSSVPTVPREQYGLIKLYMSFNNEAIKLTKLYDELDSVSMNDRVELSFSELVSLLRSKIDEAKKMWEDAPLNDSELTIGGFIRPSWCKLSNCPCYVPRSKSCKGSRVECGYAHRVYNPFAGGNNLRDGEYSLRGACDKWLSNVTVTVPLDRVSEIALGAWIRREMSQIVPNDTYIYHIIQTAIDNKHSVRALFLIGAALVEYYLNSEEKPFSNALQKRAEQIAACVSSSVEVFFKFLFLVRWAKRFSKTNR